MIVNELKRICGILNRVTNQNSITPLYKCVELGPQCIRVCSEFGNVEIFFGIPGLEFATLVNTIAFTAVISSLPESGDITFKQNQNQISWQCGSAKGVWSVAVSDSTIPLLAHSTFPWKPSPSDLCDALELSGAACEATTVAVGLYGIEVRPDGDKLRFTSCNAVSLASAVIPTQGYSGGKIVLRPPVPAILALLLKSTKNSAIDVVDGQGIFFISDEVAAHLPLSTPLDQDLSRILNTFQTCNHVIEVDSKAIRNFLGRAKAMADKGGSVNVGLRIADGQLVLEHSSLMATSEEYFLASGLDPSLKFNSVMLTVNLISASIEHVKSVTLDFLEKNTLVLNGVDPYFIHIIGGQNK